jgi:hypothetical protein
MNQKAAMAERLLGRGLTVSQVSAQLKCSKPFVRRIRQQIAVGTAPAETVDVA